MDIFLAILLRLALLYQGLDQMTKIFEWLYSSKLQAVSSLENRFIIYEDL